MSKFLIVVLGVLISSTVAAHGIGRSFEETRDGYKVDIGVSEEIISLGENVRISLELYNASNQEAVDFTETWVLLSNNQTTMFSGNIIRPENGLLPVLNYTFVTPGTYGLTVRFMKANEELIESTFPFEVEGSVKEDGGTNFNFQPILFTVSGLIFGLLISRLVRQKNE
jgi:hypothetical protein